MNVVNGIDNGKPKVRNKKFDLFRPVSVKVDGRRVTSPNWCVRFQHKGKRTCRSLGTPDFRQAQQRAKVLIASVRQQGWASAATMPSSHGTMIIDDFLVRYEQAAVSRSLRPRSISHAKKDLRRLAREIGARRLGDLTTIALQRWIQDCQLKPITLRTVLMNAGSVFARKSLLAMGMTDLENPFVKLVSPKVDREPFAAPTRVWITDLMAEGIKELKDDVQKAFVLALGCGLRWGEIVSLTWENVQSTGVRVLASLAKGRRQRVVPIAEIVWNVLKVSQRQGTVIQGDAIDIHENLCNWLRKQEVKDSKPVHFLRKCYGSMAVADHGIFVASKLLGHSTITLTASTYAGQVDKLPAVCF